MWQRRLRSGVICKGVKTKWLKQTGIKWGLHVLYHLFWICFRSFLLYHFWKQLLLVFIFIFRITCPGCIPKPTLGIHIKKSILSSIFCHVRDCRKVLNPHDCPFAVLECEKCYLTCTFSNHWMWQHMHCACFCWAKNKACITDEVIKPGKK
jgi:hypothetical protein